MRPSKSTCLRKHLIFHFIFIPQIFQFAIFHSFVNSSKNHCENWIFSKGLNGTECVLKTLCEVGQKQHDIEPGSFLAEIVRAVFRWETIKMQIEFPETIKYSYDSISLSLSYIQYTRIACQWPNCNVLYTNDTSTTMRLIKVRQTVIILCVRIAFFILAFDDATFVKPQQCWKFSN